MFSIFSKIYKKIKQMYSRLKKTKQSTTVDEQLLFYTNEYATLIDD